jgi:hypothetical protein
MGNTHMAFGVEVDHGNRHTGKHVSVGLHDLPTRHPGGIEASRQRWAGAPQLDNFTYRSSRVCHIRSTIMMDSFTS